MASCGGSLSARCDLTTECSTHKDHHDVGSESPRHHHGGHHHGGHHHGGHSLTRSLTMIATTEKEDIRTLNDRLGDLFSRLEHHRVESGKCDHTPFMAAIASMQEELKKMKSNYEHELNNVRRDHEKTRAEKSAALNAAEEHRKHAERLQAQLHEHCAEIEKLRAEINQLKATLEQRNAELSCVTSQLQQAHSDIAMLKPKVEKYHQQAEDYRKQLEHMRHLKMEFEDKYKSTFEKLTFDTRMHEQHARDLNERIKKQNDIIEELNAKLKAAIISSESKINTNLLLDQMREKVRAEIAAYKLEAEEVMRKALADMQHKLDKAHAENHDLAAERDRLNSLIAQLQGRINELEGQIGALQRSNDQLHAALIAQKQESAHRIRELEKKLAELHERMQCKIRELIEAREVQTSLRTEIEGYRAMLDAEEMRLSKPLLPPLHGGGGITTSYQGGLSCHAIGYPPMKLSPRACCASSHESGGSGGVIHCSNLISASHQPTSTSGTHRFMCPTHSTRMKTLDVKVSGSQDGSTDCPKHGGLHNC